MVPRESVEMVRIPSSTKNRREVRRMLDGVGRRREIRNRAGKIARAEKRGDKHEPWPTPTAQPTGSDNLSDHLN